MTPETSPPTAGSSGGKDKVAGTQNQYPTSKPTTINGGQGWGWSGCGRRGGYQGHGRQGGYFNQTPNTPSIINFKGRVE